MRALLASMMRTFRASRHAPALFPAGRSVQVPEPRPEPRPRLARVAAYGNGGALLLVVDTDPVVKARHDLARPEEPAHVVQLVPDHEHGPRPLRGPPELVERVLSADGAWESQRAPEPGDRPRLAVVGGDHR